MKMAKATMAAFNRRESIYNRFFEPGEEEAFYDAGKPSWLASKATLADSLQYDPK